MSGASGVDGGSDPRALAAGKDFLWLHLRELPYFRSILRAVEARFYQGLDLPKPILDVGCGDGHFATVVFDSPIDVGIDLHLPSLREANRRGAYRLLLDTDGTRLPIRSASLGSAFSNSVLEHLPDLDGVLAEIARTLKPGAPLFFTVPNPGYRTELSFPRFLASVGLSRAARAYQGYFMWMSRTRNMMYEAEWAERLGRAGLAVERTARYFSPAALHALEWGHYFGAPSLVARWLTGHWIVAPHRWNLWLTERLTRRYYLETPCSDGTYSFYLARKMA
jgi:SAM-dependent methyltransferase